MLVQGTTGRGCSNLLISYTFLTLRKPEMEITENEGTLPRPSVAVCRYVYNYTVSNSRVYAHANSLVSPSKYTRYLNPELEFHKE